MKTFFTRNHGCTLLLASAVLVGGCAMPVDTSSANAQSASASSPTSAASWARDSLDAWNRHDVGALVNLQGATGEFITPTGAIVGPAIGPYAQSVFGAQPDFKLKVLNIYPVSETVAVAEWEGSGTWTNPYKGGPLAGAKPTGKFAVLKAVSIIKTKDGKLVTHKQYFDRMDFLKQMGVLAAN